MSEPTRRYTTLVLYVKYIYIYLYILYLKAFLSIEVQMGHNTSLDIVPSSYNTMGSFYR